MKGALRGLLLGWILSENGKAQLAVSQAGTNGPLTNYEESPLRWNYEVLLAEFKALREEIISVKAQIEQTYTYLFALIGAIAASRLLSEETLDVVYAHHSAFLFAALLSLWFPLNHLLMSADMIVAGAYIRDFIAPKLNHISRLMVERSGQPPKSYDGLQGWAESIREGGNLHPDTIYETLKKPMSWEEFAAQMRLKQRRRVWIFTPLYLARTFLLYVPMALLIYLFLETPYRRLVDNRFYVETTHAAGLGVFYDSLSVAALSGTIVVLTILSLGAQVSTSKLLLRGTHREQSLLIKIIKHIF